MLYPPSVTAKKAAHNAWCRAHLNCRWCDTECYGSVRTGDDILEDDATGEYWHYECYWDLWESVLRNAPREATKMKLEKESAMAAKPILVPAPLKPTAPGVPVPPAIQPQSLAAIAAMGELLAKLAADGNYSEVERFVEAMRSGVWTQVTPGIGTGARR